MPLDSPVPPVRDSIIKLADRIIRRIKQHRTAEGFSDDQIYTIMDEALRLLQPLGALVTLEAPCLVFGDIHGQLTDLLRFWELVGSPPKKQWLCLGDYVDRGCKGFEVILLLICYKIKFPTMVHLLRGNHECQKTNRIYGFYTEMAHKRSIAMWLRFNKLFNELPLVASIGGRVLGMHGGISQGIKGWETLQNLKKPKSINECDEGVQVDLLWADPTNESCDYRFNINRNTSVMFGETALRAFCKLLNLDLVVRAHEAIQDGFQFTSGKRCCTLFSAPNYCGNDGNSASVMHVGAAYDITFTTLQPRISSKETPSASSQEPQPLCNYTNVKSPSLQPSPHHSIPKESSGSKEDASGGVPLIPPTVDGGTK